MILIIDNYDSFVFTIGRYCEELGEKIRIVRNDAIDLVGIAALKLKAILISPGPCTPREAGISLEILGAYSGKIPILGICLGHQCVGAYFGGQVVPAQRPCHGRVLSVRHDHTGVFKGLPSPLPVGCYHSLIVEGEEKMAPSLRVVGRAQNGEIMALAHKTYPTLGVQFHPESILTPDGYALMKNFLTFTHQWWHGAVV